MSLQAHLKHGVSKRVQFHLTSGDEVIGVLEKIENDVAVLAGSSPNAAATVIVIPHIVRFMILPSSL